MQEICINIKSAKNREDDSQMKNTGNFRDEITRVEYKNRCKYCNYFAVFMIYS